MRFPASPRRTALVVSAGMFVLALVLLLGLRSARPTPGKWRFLKYFA